MKSTQFPGVTRSVGILRYAQQDAGSAESPALSPLPPATQGMPPPPPRRSFPWRWASIGAGLLAGLALLAVAAGMLSTWVSGSRLTQTTQAGGAQTAAVLGTLPSQTATRTPTLTSTPSPPPLSPTSTPSSLPPSSTPTAEIYISPMDGMVLRYVPGGTFLMGSERGEIDERPVHTVTLDAFWMDQTEVTNAMYALCVEDGDCSPLHRTDSYTRSSYYGEAAYADYPVIWVDWYQAQAYCIWAGRELPSEAQWEYAARGGLDGALYPWGDESPSCTLGAWNGAQYLLCSTDDSIPVGSFAPNGYGLFDMAGNVWEWVADWFGAYSSAAVENPSGPASGDYRLLRGGAWFNYGGYLRVSDRDWHTPDFTYYNLGFRCASTP